MAAEIVAIDPGADAHERVAETLKEICGDLAAWDQLRGFALVVWDGRGKSRGAMVCSEGPISEDLAPLYVQQQIAGMVTGGQAQAGKFEEI